MSKRHNKAKNKHIKEEHSENEEYDSEDNNKHPKKDKHRSKGLKRMKGANRFFEDEAEEGNDSDNEISKANLKDQYYDAATLQRRTKNYNEKLKEIQHRAVVEERNRNIKNERRANAFDADGNRIRHQVSQSDEDGSLNGYAEDSDELMDELTSQKELLPSVNDPKIWQVKVKKGLEKTATFALINKSIDFQMRGKPLEILSATCVDNVENYIFVEAFRKNSVIEALSGLNFWGGSINKIEILSLNEMTKVYETLKSNQIEIPEVQKWVRIKGGLYDKDLAVVEKIISDDKICCKIIPRIDPNPQKQDNFKKFRNMSRNPQKAFDLHHFKDATKAKNFQFSNRTMYQWRSYCFRKGFLYKTFPLKQIETTGVKPTIEERNQFLEIYEKNIKGLDQNDDSSEGNFDEKRTFFNTDLNLDFGIGDKINVTTGELQGATGIIQNFEGTQVIFKPTNLDGFEDNLMIEIKNVVKYFEIGDQVRIMEGKYKGETGMVTDVNNDPTKIELKSTAGPKTVLYHPICKLDKSQREIRVHRNNLKLKGDHDKDVQRLVDLGNKQNGGIGQASCSNTNGEVYRVGEVIIYNGNKTFGYIIQVQDDFLKIVNDHSIMTQVRITEVDKKLNYDKKNFTRDQAGNILSIDDVVKISSDDKTMKGKKGIVKNICKSCLFLWDPKDYSQSGGIFVETTRNVLILGTEFLKGDAENKAVCAQNRIIKDKMFGKIVQIVKGQFKGQRGRVTKINGDEAILELSTRSKKISLPKTDVREIDLEESGSYGGGGIGNGGQSQYGTNNRGGFGGGQSFYGNQSAYNNGGGQTAYDAGKTPMAFNTPMYQPYTPARDLGGGGGEPNWGANTPAASNIRDQAFSKIASEYGDGAAANWGQDGSQNNQNEQPVQWGQEIKKENTVEAGWG